MTDKNWEEIAAQEFSAMDNQWRAEWSDLRKRVARR